MFFLSIEEHGTYGGLTWKINMVGNTLEEDHNTPWRINDWFTYSHHPWKERKMIWTKPPWGHVPAVNLQGCRILDGGLVIPLIFPKVLPIFEKESLGFPRNTPSPLTALSVFFGGIKGNISTWGSKSRKDMFFPDWPLFSFENLHSMGH